MAKLDKPIIHFRLPHDENGNPKDIDYNLANVFLAWAKQELGDKAYITMSPYDISASGAEVENVKLDAITLKEFLKKHKIKDGAGE